MDQSLLFQLHLEREQVFARWQELLRASRIGPFPGINMLALMQQVWRDAYWRLVEPDCGRRAVPVSPTRELGSLGDFLQAGHCAFRERLLKIMNRQRCDIRTVAKAAEELSVAFAVESPKCPAKAASVSKSAGSRRTDVAVQFEESRSSSHLEVASC